MPFPRELDQLGPQAGRCMRETDQRLEDLVDCGLVPITLAIGRRHRPTARPCQRVGVCLALLYIAAARPGSEAEKLSEPTGGPVDICGNDRNVVDWEQRHPARHSIRFVVSPSVKMAVPLVGDLVQQILKIRAR
ncbi:hypothetical protein BDW74DRAFT_163620 [Aspergillus multicolor]|uniref:uncharacterized protein n=1 Tax=Aspergillus multicolor TaxID=41759 RepID=UPI003CCD89B2